MLTIKECERILRENGYVMSDDLDLRELRDYLYRLAELQIENEEKCCKNGCEIRKTEGNNNSG
jgi:hypothetical protein